MNVDFFWDMYNANEIKIGMDKRMNNIKRSMMGNTTRDISLETAYRLKYTAEKKNCEKMSFDIFKEERDR